MERKYRCSFIKNFPITGFAYLIANFFDSPRNKYTILRHAITFNYTILNGSSVFAVIITRYSHVVLHTLDYIRCLHTHRFHWFLDSYILHILHVKNVLSTPCRCKSCELYRTLIQCSNFSPNLTVICINYIEIDYLRHHLGMRYFNKKKEK